MKTLHGSLIVALAAFAGTASAQDASRPMAMDHMSMDQSMSMPMQHETASDKHDKHDMKDMKHGSKAQATDPDHVPPPPPTRPLPPASIHMDDNPLLAMLRIDELERVHTSDTHGTAWDVQGWVGRDINKLWLKSEGDRSGGRLESARTELLWDHAFAAWWDWQAGVRHDTGGGPSRDWAAFGVQGLAPYKFDTEATFYVGPSGRTAARVSFEYTLRFTQRLILTPKFELDAYGKADPQRGLGAGLSEGSFGLRLRYEIRRQFAPYVGVVWTHRFAGTADIARARGERVSDTRLVAGLRMWF